MSAEIKDGDILELIEKTAQKLQSDKDTQRVLMQIFNTLHLVKNIDKQKILHICPECKRQTLENIRTKAKDLGIDIVINQTVSLTENLNIDSNS